VSQSDPYRLPGEPGEPNPYAAPSADLAAPDEPFFLTGSAHPILPFSIDSVLSRSWAIYKDQMGLTIALVIGGYGINWVVQTAGSLMTGVVAAGNPAPAAILAAQAVVMAASMVFSYWLVAGQALGLLNLARGRRAEFADLFRGGPYLLRFLLGLLLVALAALAVAALFVAPVAGLVYALGPNSSGAIGIAVAAGLVGVVLLIVFSVRISLFTYALVDQNLGALDAVRASVELTRGHALEVFALLLIAGVIGVAGFLACLVGAVFTLPLATLIPVVAYVALAQGYGPDPVLKKLDDSAFDDFV